MLSTSHFAYRCRGPQRRGSDLERRNFVRDKLRVLVRVDLDGAQAQVAAQGHVTVHSVQGLYDVMKRASSLLAGLALELDMKAPRSNRTP